jgi:uncharacterized PurR-regulated membrane protein YhhQ (DUF165 family)
MITLLFIGSTLIVYGFTFMVIAVTSKLTEIKGKTAANKLVVIGIIPIIAGVILSSISTSFNGDIKNAMLTASFNLYGLGITSLLQRFAAPKFEKLLKYAANCAVIVGFTLWIVYVILLYFKQA